MSTKPLHLIYALLVCVWAGLLWGAYRLHGDNEASRPPLPRVQPPQKHYVAPRQLTASGRLIGHAAPPFENGAHDGRTYRLADLCSERPLVLVFLKAGCPCNLDFEPIVQQLHARYHNHAAFAEVIDSSVDFARKYAEEVKTPYPILADPGLTLIRGYQVENGGYVVLIGRDAVIDKVWPGFSTEMVQELSQRIAELAGIEAAVVDMPALPTVLTTGCPY